jgi:4-amino-4-deoxy-L-arabinose transferase-like glycosyltransferase
MKLKLSSILLISGILLFAAILRLYGLNWDQGHHLHPDERFLTMVGNSMKVPESFSKYLNPQVSTFNPVNIGFPFYVYGIFPVVIAKLLSINLIADNYTNFTLLGRILSALSDVAVVLLVFKIVRLFEKHSKLSPAIKFWASGFYAISVLPIQLSHFFTVDMFLNLFIFSSLYTLLKYSFEKKVMYLIYSAVFLGLAIASKISAVFIFPLILYLIIRPKIKHIKKLFLLLILYGLVSFFTLRFADPYLFQSANLFDPKPNVVFINNITQLKNLSNPDVWYPPSVQWRHKTPVIFALQNIAIFGLGLPVFLSVLAGIIIVLRKYRKTKLFPVLIWTLLFFLYQSTQAAKTMRYFIIIYPLLAIFAGIGIVGIIKLLKQNINNNFILNTLYIILYTSFLIWPLSFMSIYTKPHSRVQASNWIYDKFQNESIIFSEHWDDALPLRLENKNKTFNIIELPVFGEDTPEKWNEINMRLSKGDYLILSSNRGWGSIMESPERYPIMSKFYQDLFSDKLSYKKIATFTSYPSLNYLGIPLQFSDDFAEEAFTVNDHPKVMIFKKTN